MSEKKHKSGYDLLKEKYDAIVIERDNLHSTVAQQGTKISQLTADLTNARADAREYKRQRDEAIKHMGWLRRLWYGFSLPE